MTHEFYDDDPDVRDALQDLFRHRHEHVDFAGLNERIIADAERRYAPQGPADVLAAWSGRTAITAGSLIAAGLAALLLFSGGGEKPAPPGFWPVAEELLASLPPDTRRMIAAGSEPGELLELIAADVREEVDLR